MAGRIRHYLATNWTTITSFHPFVNTTEMVMVRTFRNYLGVFNSILCRKKKKEGQQRYEKSVAGYYDPYITI